MLVARACALVAALAALRSVRGDEVAAIPQPIADLRLSNGRVLHAATILRYEDKWVVLKTLGGTGPVNYEMIAEPLRSQMLADRDAKRRKANATVIVGVDETTKVTGNVISGDGEQVYRFPRIRVEFVPRKFALKKMNPTLGTHEPFDHVAATTLANENGEFEAEIPSGDYIVNASATRRYRNGNAVHYDWVVDLTATAKPATIVLNDANAKISVQPPTPKKKK